MTQRDARPTLAAPDDDPYIWLEDIDGEKAVAWVDQRSKATLERFSDAGFERDRDAVKAIYDRDDNIPYAARHGTFLYNFWRDSAHPRGLWRRTTLDSYRLPEPEWEALLDLDALAAEENEDWTWAGASIEPTERRRAIIRLSRGGSDAVVLREFDIADRHFVADGFSAPEAKSSTEWVDAETLLLSSSFGEGMAAQSGYARTTRLWRRGSAVSDAPVVFEVEPSSMMVLAQFDRSGDTPRVWFKDWVSYLESNIWLGDENGAQERIDLPRDAEWQVDGDWLTVKPRTPYTPAATTFAPDTLIGMRFSAFRAGERSFAVLFTPSERRVLDRFFWVKERLVLCILDNLKPRVEIITPAEGQWRSVEANLTPPTGAAYVWTFDADPADSNGEVLISFEDPLTPPQLSLANIAAPDAPASPVVLKLSPSVFDASGLVITQHEAVSVDGEHIPYTQVGPTEDTGDAPVHMTAYGGFGISLQPSYAADVGKVWLERGGTTVVANLRGGGEFGARWHEAGRREGKFLSHEDFAAVAADLVRRGVTRPGRIAAEGGSNGGLLIANMLTRHPEKFGALFCTVPLIDMRRYTKLLAGPSWIDEYGDPDKPEDWAFLQKISAYHMAADGAYPPIMIATTHRDDRVHPAHARKMTAKLEALSHRVHFYEPAAGGHSYGKDHAERAAFLALGYSFLRKAIGWED